MKIGHYAQRPNSLKMSAEFIQLPTSSGKLLPNSKVLYRFMTHFSYWLDFCDTTGSRQRHTLSCVCVSA